MPGLAPLGAAKPGLIVISYQVLTAGGHLPIGRGRVVEARLTRFDAQQRTTAPTRRKVTAIVGRAAIVSTGEADGTILAAQVAGVLRAEFAADTSVEFHEYYLT